MTFKKSSRNLSRAMCLKNFKITAIIIVVVLVIILYDCVHKLLKIDYIVYVMHCLVDCFFLAGYHFLHYCSCLWWLQLQKVQVDCRKVLNVELDGIWLGGWAEL